MAGVRCPNCGDAMLAQALAGRQGPVEIDLCYGCQGIWFDKMESPALADASVIELFKRIHEHRDEPRRPMGARTQCPRCRSQLAHTKDVQRGNPIEYERCPDGDGRYTTFFQFLREKHFVRSLGPQEVTALRAQVAQVLSLIHISEPTRPY